MRTCPSPATLTLITPTRTPPTPPSEHPANSSRTPNKLFLPYPPFILIHFIIQVEQTRERIILFRNEHERHKEVTGGRPRHIHNTSKPEKIGTDAHSPSDPLRQFDLHAPSIDAATPPPLLCFVHGGAWRAEDKKDYAAFARRLAHATGLPVAVPNYRLTPPDNVDPAFHHPIHTADILLFLTFLQSYAPHSPVRFDPTRIVLLGHSCSAHMIAAIVLDSDEATPALRPAPEVRRAVRGVVLSEGIYDLDLLLARFPAYRAWFIAPAFGDLPSYANLSVTSYPLRPSPDTDEDTPNTDPDTDSNPAWLLIHSTGDTLVDTAQTHAMQAHLALLDPRPGRVTISTDVLVEDHDDVLHADAYVQLVRAFAARVFGLGLDKEANATTAGA